MVKRIPFIPGILIALALLIFLLNREGGTPSVTSTRTQTARHTPPIQKRTRSLVVNDPSVEERAQFRTLTDRALGELPTVLQVQKAPGHPHSEALTQGVDTFAAIFDSVKANPNLIPDAISFYDKCATRSDVHEAIRANCLRYLVDASARIGRNTNLSPYPREIVRIARWIPKKSF